MTFHWIEKGINSNNTMSNYRRTDRPYIRLWESFMSHEAKSFFSFLRPDIIAMSTLYGHDRDECHYQILSAFRKKIDVVTQVRFGWGLKLRWFNLSSQVVIVKLSVFALFLRCSGWKYWRPFLRWLFNVTTLLQKQPMSSSTIDTYHINKKSLSFASTYPWHLLLKRRSSGNLRRETSNSSSLISTGVSQRNC